MNDTIILTARYPRLSLRLITMRLIKELIPMAKG